MWYRYKKYVNHFGKATNKISTGFPVLILFVGRIDPVECIGVSQQRNGNVLNVKPPAMRVRDDCYTKITFPL